MKKFLALVLSVAFIFSFAACDTSVESEVDDIGSKVESGMENR